ncbi:unnamed protein product [Brassica rapa subsp. narinosa]
MIIYIITLNNWNLYQIQHTTVYISHWEGQEQHGSFSQQKKTVSLIYPKQLYLNNNTTY